MSLSTLSSLFLLCRSWVSLKIPTSTPSLSKYSPGPSTDFHWPAYAFDRTTFEGAMHLATSTGISLASCKTFSDISLLGYYPDPWFLQLVQNICIFPSGILAAYSYVQIFLKVCQVCFKIAEPYGYISWFSICPEPIWNPFLRLFTVFEWVSYSYC